MTTTTTDLANIPKPAGATFVDEWCLQGGAARQFQGTLRQMPDYIYDDTHEFDVLTAGEQRRDGTVDRYVSFGGHHLDPHQAIVMATDLAAAAAESYQMAARDAGVPTEDQADRTHQINDAFRSINAILDMYPSRTWSLEEASGLFGRRCMRSRCGDSRVIAAYSSTGQPTTLRTQTG